MRRAVEFVGSIPYRRDMVALLAAANMLGALYGFSWYRGQLAVTPWYVWPLVPDSPLSALLFSLVLFGILARRRLPLLEGIAYVGIVKYGMWSVALIAQYWVLTGNVGDFELAHLFLSHSIMALQGLWFAYHHHPGRVAVAAGTAWAVVNDVVDYGFGHYPTLPLAGQLPFARGAAMALTALVAAALWTMRRAKTGAMRGEHGNGRD